MLAGYGIWLSYRAWVAEMVNRYRNDPTILAWQLINEAEVNPGGAFGVCPPGDVPRDELIAWAGDVSNLVRSIDPNHLISLGTIGGGQCGSQGSQYQDVHALPNIDLCEYHDYSPAMAMPTRLAARPAMTSSPAPAATTRSTAATAMTASMAMQATTA